MRVEKIRNNIYAKTLDQTEAEIASVMNRYFKSTIFQENTKDSRQALIDEVLKRIRPFISSIVEGMIAAEIKAQVSGYVDSELPLVVEGKIVDIIANIDWTKLQVNKIAVMLEEGDNLLRIPLPNGFEVNLSGDVLSVYVNGMQQVMDFNYRLITKPDNSNIVSAVDFDVDGNGIPVLEVGDIISFTNQIQPRTI